MFQKQGQERLLIWRDPGPADAEGHPGLSGQDPAVLLMAVCGEQWGVQLRLHPGRLLHRLRGSGHL